MALMSYGLYKAMDDILDASGKQVDQNQVNQDICDMIVNEFRIQTSIQSVAQAVVNRICQMHRDVYSTSNLNSDRVEDISLLIRNFNHPLVNGPCRVKRPTRLSLPDAPKLGELTVSVGPAEANPIPPPISDDVLVTVTHAAASSGAMSIDPENFSNYRAVETNTQTIQDTQLSNDATLTNSTSTSSGFTDNRFNSERARSTEKFELDADGKINSYVDFSELTEAVERLKANGTIPAEFTLETLETIHE